MKNFKIIDFIIQIFLIVSLLVKSLIDSDKTFLYAYCIIGGWQVLSMMVHQYNRWYTNNLSRRYYYHRITMGVILTMAFAYLIPIFFIFWYLMLFAAPIMAIYYTAICYREVFYPVKRPLDLI